MILGVIRCDDSGVVVLFLVRVSLPVCGFAVPVDPGSEVAHAALMTYSKRAMRFGSACVFEQVPCPVARPQGVRPSTRFHQLCPICGWGGDSLDQLRFPNMPGSSANHGLSLVEAQKNYLAHGPAERRKRGQTRSPFDSDEPRDEQWRPVDALRDNIERKTAAGGEVMPTLPLRGCTVGLPLASFHLPATHRRLRAAQYRTSGSWCSSSH